MLATKSRLSAKNERQQSVNDFKSCKSGIYSVMRLLLDIFIV